MAVRVGGIIQVMLDGELVKAKGVFSYNIGRPKREEVMGLDGFHGYKETPQPAFCEGEITDRGELDLNKLVTLTNSTVTIALANGKVFVLRNAFFAGEGTVKTDEGTIAVRFVGDDGEETR